MLKGQIYLYGESHGVEKIMDKQLEIWGDYYHNHGMRHLFVEVPYYTAEFRNIWMKANNDEILLETHRDAEGTEGAVPYELVFLRTIKREFPETIFHGTDVGHQFYSTGERFLRYLEENNMKNTMKYALTKEAIDQGKCFYENEDWAYREYKMLANFVREFANLGGRHSIMGIYGANHVIYSDHMHDVPVLTMAKQLRARYGDALHTFDLSWMHLREQEALLTEPLHTEKKSVDGREYTAHYFGVADMRGWSEKYSQRQFWRLENAYTDFKNAPTYDNILTYDQYPMLIKTGQIFLVEYTRKDNSSVERQFFRSDGNEWNGELFTHQFIAERTG